MIANGRPLMQAGSIRQPVHSCPSLPFSPPFLLLEVHVCHVHICIYIYIYLYLYILYAYMTSYKCVCVYMYIYMHMTYACVPAAVALKKENPKIN